MWVNYKPVDVEIDDDNTGMYYHHLSLLSILTSCTTGPKENLNNWQTSPRLERLLARIRASESLTPVNRAGKRCCENLGIISPQFLVALTSASPSFMRNSGERAGGLDLEGTETKAVKLENGKIVLCKTDIRCK